MFDYKLIDAEQLDSDLKRVADSIRAKANTSDSMTFPEGFISTVDSIQTEIGGSGGSDVSAKPYINTTEVDSYHRFFYNNVRLNLLNKIDTSNSTDFSYMFYACTSLTTIPILTVTKAASFAYMFSGCTALKTVPLIDTSKATNVAHMFQNCSALESIAITTIPSDLSTLQTFKNAALKTLEIGKGFATSLYLTVCENLTQESLHGMIENLADLSGTTSKSFNIGDINIAKIDTEHIAMLEAKNWTYS